MAGNVYALAIAGYFNAFSARTKVH